MPAPPVVTKPVSPKAAPAPVRRKPAPERPSVGDTASIHFAGSAYALGYKGESDGGAVRQYYPAGESAVNWARVIELRVYPAAGKKISPAEYAEQLAKTAQAANPYLKYVLETNRAQGTALLYFTTWNDATLEAHYNEFDVYKLIPGRKDGDLIGFHYVEKLYVDLNISTEANRDKIGAEKQLVLHDMAKVPLYQE
ncbi:MAG TPA: hypothetical protein VGT42_07395 [Gammaproteobacteria bacterium]|nr:hypothetical protein [Gammaproteobacteria bacterium]